MNLPIARDSQREALALARRPREDYLYILKFGLAHVTMSALRDQEADVPKVAGKVTDIRYCETGVEILAGIPRMVLEHLIKGDLFRSAHVEDNLRRHFRQDSEWMQRASNSNHPGIYIRGIVTNAGHAPTTAQWQRAIVIMRLYVSGMQDRAREVAAEIDNLTTGVKVDGSDLANGSHRYLDGSEDRVMKILTFCEALATRLKDTPADRRNEPLPWSHTYVGYSVNMRQQQTFHNTDKTSWFQNFVLAALRHGGGSFRIDFLPICFLWDKDQASVAEQVLTVISDSMYVTGGGLGVCEAGVQTTSIRFDNKTPAEQDAIWKECRNFRDNCTPSSKNKEEECRVLSSGIDKELEVVSPLQQLRAEVEAEEEALRKTIEAVKDTADRVEGYVDRLLERAQRMTAMPLDDEDGAPEDNDNAELAQMVLGAAKMLKNRVTLLREDAQ